tara:strand:+ start:1329 stop:2585 length:1257 start_codon:yes stop_codon:yes gene_type:complete
MPAEECNNGKWKWGETGECKYETQEEAEEDNEDYYEESEEMKIDKRHIISVTEDDETYTIVYEKDRDKDEIGDDEEETEQSSESRDINKLNSKGYDNALALVKADKVDRNSDWDFTAADGNELLGDDDWDNYGKWFLGIDTEADRETKGYYGYPYGKDGKVYREALIATRQYAGRFNLTDIFDAAGKLLDIIDEEKDSLFYDTERNKPFQKEVKDIWTKNITMEKRYFNIDTRTEKREDGSTTITGHAAVFNQMSSDLGGFREIIAPNAFENVLNDDVRALVNHDPNLLLARTTSGTLNLEQTEKGLQYSFDVPDTTYGRDLIISMERGDVSQSSFAFTIEDDSWETTEDGEVRTINKVKQLYDVSPVTYPAYPDADDLTLAQRSLAVYKEKEENEKQEKDLVKRSLLKLKIELKKRK